MLRFLPWRFIVTRAARRYGIMDPVSWLARLRSFAQPSEVSEPLELLRAGIVFHARGLVNVKAIQHNLDWVWPFWVERQFKPGDPSFVPRAFSFSHINLTHRNWTAVGLPELPVYPIVDPRGLVTPLHDGWSLDFWIITEKGGRLLPGKLEDRETRQELVLEPTLAVETSLARDDLRIESRVWVEVDRNGMPRVKCGIRARSPEEGWLVAAIRPYNPEGVQFIDEIRLDGNGESLWVNDHTAVSFGEKIEGLRMAHYAEGDVYLDLPGDDGVKEIRCAAGMATAAALFRLTPDRTRMLNVDVPLARELKERSLPAKYDASHTWDKAAAPTARLKIPDGKMRFLYDAAVRTLILLSAGDLVPGPSTYRRFWFRDACLMLNPLLAIGLLDRAERILQGFPARQNLSGYFQSQEGEWDSNGQVLWIAARHAAITGKPLGAEMERALRKGTRWLSRKRLPADAKGGTGGLLPAGFSAEHLGPNDFYYWDDYWAVGGLRSAAAYWRTRGNSEAAAEADQLAEEYLASIEKSLAGIPAKRSRGAIPAAPGRRMDAGAVGSMVADYPLQIYPPGEARIMATLDYLKSRCFFRGGFLQEMIHSGINAYLTLDLAQTLLRAGDARFADLIRTVAGLASPTGQWPEAIHPNTLGGCMGDGQHGWAAGEWVMMMRACFVREEELDHKLVIGSGVLPEWLEEGDDLLYGPTPTPWGDVTVRISGGNVVVEATWRGEAPVVEIAVPDFVPISPVEANRPYPLEKKPS